MKSSTPSGVRLALLLTAAVTLTFLALTESYGQFAAGVAAYVAGWWVLGLEQGSIVAREEQP